MAQTNRLSALGSLLFTALLVAACGGTPEVPSTGTTPDVGGNGSGGSPDGTGGTTYDFGGGSSDAGTSAGGDSGTSGDDGPQCGNGKLEGKEACDDGNTTPGDGCDGTCSKIDENWKCPTPGKKCVYSPADAVCGNGVLETGETCDLGKTGTKSNNDGSKGCAADCQTVPGYTCPADGGACTKESFCGDGKVTTTIGEQCDDGTNDGAHGCDVDCKQMKGWICPPTGGACKVDVSCGNGKVDSGEYCDDHNQRNYDGCTDTCFIEPGFSCPPTGGTCTRLCGNGVLDQGEACDDSNFYSGDGCASNCLKVEKDYTCATVGQPCVYTPAVQSECGNGKLETGEVCDDGNANSGDGCSNSCVVEAGWKCGAQNTACVADKCGDHIVAGTEVCDDGINNTTSGCTPSCTVAPNATCTADGKNCVPMLCGDGKVTGTETCDSGTNDGKHGCSTTCQTVTGWICPLPGAPCAEVCGDGIVVGGEQCDEKGDALCCTATCTLKPNYVCDPSKTPHSQPAAPYCGNNVINGPSNANSTVLGNEQCDDGNKIPFDGCSPTCTNEPLCGTVNTYLNPLPAATTYQCFAHCGDGLVLAGEECDDGNTVDNDGCDHNCKVETVPGSTPPKPAWTCSQPPPSAGLTLPVIWRDFTPRTHPQFSVDPRVNRRLPNMTLSKLKAVNVGGARPYRYVPEYNTGFVAPAFGTTNAAFQNKADWTMNGPGYVANSEGYQAPPWMDANDAYVGVDLVWYSDRPATLNTGNANVSLTPAGRFAQWFIDDATVNKSFAGSITLSPTAVAGQYQYSCDTTACDSVFASNPSPASPIGFFPIDGQGWVATNPVQETKRNGNHNYSFTTESRSWFAFKGGEQLEFYGDDDLWVFINGTLALDVGGIHSKTKGRFTLNADGTASIAVQDLPGQDATTHQDLPFTTSTVNLGLKVTTPPTVYEIAIFNAEREVIEANFQLTLTGFNNSPSVCTPICGDGFAAGNEQCDQGSLNVPPTGNTQNKCTTECKLGPYCGDKLLQKPPETCDNGLNIDAYTLSVPGANQCAPMCVAPNYCGDTIVQKANGEECDNGAANNVGGYGKCSSNCKLGQRCGDKSVQSANGEQCDDGANNGSTSSNCDATCKKKCGNGKLEAGEDCDDGSGASGNGTASSACSSTCQFKCGNGALDPGEDCDDGKNDGSYGTCKSNCKFAPYCGDKSVQSPPEVCDKGSANSATAYGADSCTDACLPGGSCGDGVVNGTEKCDDGKNTGMPGSCKGDCSAYVPSTLCGDGVIQAPEKCDDGPGVNGNGSASSTCDTACRLKCGNALIDAPETCDNGVNDGSYGGCTTDCKPAGYCGDGKKNGNEQCDKGAGNVAVNTAYGTDVCTKACKAAPFCGDGKIQAALGEECEGNVNCKNCLSTIIK